MDGAVRSRLCEEQKKQQVLSHFFCRAGDKRGLIHTDLSISSTTSWYTCWYSSTERLWIIRGLSGRGATVEGRRLWAVFETGGSSESGMVADGLVNVSEVEA